MKHKNQYTEHNAKHLVIFELPGRSKQFYNTRTFRSHEMDFVKNFTAGDNSQVHDQNQTRQQGQKSNEQGKGSFLDGFGDRLDSAAGGGRESEKMRIF